LAQLDILVDHFRHDSVHILGSRPRLPSANVKQASCPKRIAHTVHVILRKRATESARTQQNKKEPPPSRRRSSTQPRRPAAGCRTSRPRTRLPICPRHKISLCVVVVSPSTQPRRLLGRPRCRMQGWSSTRSDLLTLSSQTQCHSHNMRGFFPHHRVSRQGRSP
jgi:hypothetical protein